MFTLLLLLLGSVQTATQDRDVPWSVGAVSPRLHRLASNLRANDQSALQGFWEEMKQGGTPLIEPVADDNAHSLVTFVYRSSTAKQIVLYSQLMLGRDASTNRLERLQDSDVWFKTYSIRNDMRLSYSFLVNPTPESLTSPQAGVPDPLNAHVAPEAPYMGHSILELPDAPAQSWIVPTVGTPRGQLHEIQVQSKVLQARRKMWVYAPPSFDRARTTPYPLLICFDGDGYIAPDYMPVPTILDNLLAAGKTPPIVALFIQQSPQPNRNIELSNNEPFLNFVVDELMSLVRKDWNVTEDPSQVIVTGSSTGGLAAAFFAYRRPDIFGNVLSQSGAFWPGKVRSDAEHEWLTRQYEASSRLPVRFVLQVGLLERGATPGNGPSILETNRHLASVLRRKGYQVDYREIAGGHEPLNWRGAFPDGLLTLLRTEQRTKTPVTGR